MTRVITRYDVLGVLPDAPTGDVPKRGRTQARPRHVLVTGRKGTVISQHPQARGQVGAVLGLRNR